MRKKFIEYLRSVGITEALHGKIEAVYKFYQNVCPDEITDIFITDYITRDGSREYENLWFFSEKYCVEAKKFVIKDDFDITSIKKRIYYWAIQKQDYDFKKATEKSRLNVKFHIDTGVVGQLKASKENCAHLKDIILKHIAPNLKE